MALIARLKLKNDVPYRTEHKLVAQRGFYVVARNPKENYVIFAKQDTWKPKSTRQSPPFTLDSVNALEPTPLESLIRDRSKVKSPEDLDEQTITNLTKRCNAIMDFHTEWHSEMIDVRRRLENLAKVLPFPENEWVRNWSFNNAH